MSEQITQQQHTRPPPVEQGRPNNEYVPLMPTSAATKKRAAPAPSFSQAKTETFDDDTEETTTILSSSDIPTSSNNIPSNRAPVVPNNNVSNINNIVSNNSVNKGPSPFAQFISSYSYQSDKDALLQSKDRSVFKGQDDAIKNAKHDRGGLGHEFVLPKPFKQQKHESEMRDFPHKMELDWIRSDSGKLALMTVDRLRQQLLIGKPGEQAKRGDFCSQELIDELETEKNKLNDLDDRIFRRARTRANPYELIRGAIFQNRAAVKMANLDILADLTKTPSGQTKFHFADVCAGPGGFTEYVLYRTVGKGKKPDDQKNVVKGFGFTLKGDCDWQLDKFSPDSGLDLRDKINFQVNYGEDQTGDVLKSANIRHFSALVEKETGGGVHLFMADGGVSTEGVELQQETLLGHLILCQFLMMFETLAYGGNFVCKIFDTFNPFTVGLLYFVYQHFESFAICKPYTSRPLNSERYVIAKNLLVRKPEINSYMFDINDRLNAGENILKIVDIDDDKFKDYIMDKSNIQCLNQIEAFGFLTKAIEDQYYYVCDQKDMVNKCLREWDIPNRPDNMHQRQGGYNNNRGGRGGHYNNNRQNYHPQYQPYGNNNNQHQQRGGDNNNRPHNNYNNNRSHNNYNNNGGGGGGGHYNQQHQQQPGYDASLRNVQLPSNYQQGHQGSFPQNSNSNNPSPVRQQSHPYAKPPGNSPVGGGTRPHQQQQQQMVMGQQHAPDRHFNQQFKQALDNNGGGGGGGHVDHLGRVIPPPTVQHQPQPQQLLRNPQNIQPPPQQQQQLPSQPKPSHSAPEWI
ncbi:hypothetical protein SAMD00019534_064020 [Acytostelium subglobosum LB1]|uniref:hypothetical protein n=1 Tax=Acytostelium subglobosum LB1 TaxID=1410327 RepID=UPI000644D876|nr:hypothetical protein SAMD00019534_064020 [Acytostelium subglobosum LB1]GAM23227.1 hypothetical protein SAMD00019534_064020 [Acytostelium subglobosum LB1]|eukprot:XP_012753676.1 hypothetical protein SAMD00019534_064020 [Acytostelium subglobosum LB1]